MFRPPRRFALTALAALAGLSLYPLPAAAQESFAELCPLLLHQTRTELEDLELSIQQEETRLVVAEEVFVLLDGLWQNDLVSRLPYLGAKHRRDAAAIALDLARMRFERQSVVVEQHRLACGEPTEDEPSPGERPTREEIYERYAEADCAIRELEVTAFEIDLEYDEEVLQSALDLRQSDIASRQQVLFSDRDLQLTRQRLEQARERATRCRQ